MFRKLGFLCAALAMFSIAGGHWALLQSVAWAEMLVSYTHASGSLAVAVDETFDGQHPCALCRNIQTAKAKEHQESPVSPTGQDDNVLEAVTADAVIAPAVRFASGIVFHDRVASSALGRTEAPPTPPPRSSGNAA